MSKKKVDLEPVYRRQEPRLQQDRLKKYYSGIVGARKGGKFGK